MREEADGEEVLGASSSSGSGSFVVVTPPPSLPPPSLPPAALRTPLPPPPRVRVCRPAPALRQVRAVVVRNALGHTRTGHTGLPVAPYYTLTLCDAASRTPLPSPGTKRANAALPGVLVHTSERARGRTNPEWRDIDRTALRAACASSAASLADPAFCVCIWDRLQCDGGDEDEKDEDKQEQDDVLLAARIVAVRELRFVATRRDAETAIAARQPFALLFVLGADVYAPAADVLSVTAAVPAPQSTTTAPPELEGVIDPSGNSSTHITDELGVGRRRPVAMCDAATLVALVEAREAQRTAQEAAAAQRAALGAALARTDGAAAAQRAARDGLAARVAHLERELAAQQALLHAEQEPRRAAEAALVSAAAALTAAESTLQNARTAHRASRTRRDALTAAVRNAQDTAAQLQWRAVRDIRALYPVTAPGGSRDEDSDARCSQRSRSYTINGTALGECDGIGSIGGGEDGTASSSGNSTTAEDDEEVATALGGCAHVLVLAAQHLGVPLTYPVDARGSRSHITDPFAPGTVPRRLPLYRRGTDPALLRAAAGLLQRDAELLLAAAGPAAAARLPPGRPPSTLAALHALYEHAAATTSSPPPPFLSP